MVRSLASAMDNSEFTMSESDEHMQPKSRAPLHHSLVMSSMSPTPSGQSYWPSAPMTSDGTTSQYQNQFNQKLLRYAQNQNFEPSMNSDQSDMSSIKYCSDSVKMRGSDEYDSARSQALVGSLKLELPVDEDDYLMPSPQQSQVTSTYVDLIDSKNSETKKINNSLRAYPNLFQNNIDNPEYLMNNEAPMQTIGLPTLSEFVSVNTNNNTDAPSFKPGQTYLPQKSSEEESDHEYYNDFDRLQRELQPLQKNKNGAIV